jgi:hypothetical protein
LSVDGQRPGRGEVAEERAKKALEKLNQGNQGTKQMAQLQTMERVQEYSGCLGRTLDATDVPDARKRSGDLTKMKITGHEELTTLREVSQSMVEA